MFVIKTPDELIQAIIVWKLIDLWKVHFLYVCRWFISFTTGFVGESNGESVLTNKTILIKK